MMTDHTLDTLVKLCDITNLLAFHAFGIANTCITTSAALRDVLEALGWEAELLRVRADVFVPRIDAVAIAFDEEVMRLVSAGVSFPEAACQAELAAQRKRAEPGYQPVPHACLLGSDGDGTRLPRSRGWRGHLVVIADGRYLADPTLDQVNTDQPWLAAEPFVGRVTPAFLNGQERLEASTGPNESMVQYTAFPGRGGWKSKPAFRMSQRRELVADVLAFWEDCEAMRSSRIAG